MSKLKVVLYIYNQNVGDKVKLVVCIWHMSTVLVKTDTERGYYVLPLLIP